MIVIAQRVQDAEAVEESTCCFLRVTRKMISVRSKTAMCCVRVAVFSDREGHNDLINFQNTGAVLKLVG
jgi:hypothetical protein